MFPTHATKTLTNVTGAVDIDATQGDTFVGTITGDVTFAIKNGGARQFILVDLTFGGAGGYSVAWNGAGGITLIDPGAFTAVGATLVGSRALFLFALTPTAAYGMGANCTPAA